MPILPDYTALGERPVPRGASGVTSYTPQPLGVGEMVSQGGRQLELAAQIIAETNQRQDSIAAEAALNKAREHAASLEFGKDGYRNVQEGGVLKEDFLAGYEKRLDEGATEIAASLQNDQQKAMFKQRLPVVQLGFKSGLLQHQAKQTDAFNDRVENDSLEGELNTMARRPDDLTFKTGWSRMETIIDEAAKRKGLPEQTAKLLKSKYIERAYETRITSLLHGVPGVIEADPSAAEMLFKQATPYLGAKAINQLGQSVATVGAANDGEKAADAVWTAVGPKNWTDAVMLAPMEQAIREKFPNDADRRKAAISSLRERAAAHNATQGEVSAQATNDVLAVYARTRSISAMQKSAAWAQLPAEKRLQLETYVLGQQSASIGRDIQAMAREEQVKKLKFSAAYNAYSDPDTLSKMSRAQVQALEPTIGAEYTTHLLSRFDSLGKNLEKLPDAKIDTEDIKAVQHEMGLKPYGRNSEEDKARLGMTQSRVERMLTLAQQAKGKPLEREEKIALIRQEIAKTVSVETWGGLNSKAVPVVELTPEQISKVIVPPQEWSIIRDQMAELYKRSGGAKQYEPTPDNLKRFYLQYRVGSGTARMIP